MRKMTWIKWLNLSAATFCGVAAVAHFTVGNIGFGILNLALAIMNGIFLLEPNE